MNPIPMLDLHLEYEYMKKQIDTAIANCLRHQQWILGPEVKEIEERMTAYLGLSQCIGVSSGTDALVLSLRALAIKLKNQEYFDRTDSIITTPFTYTATVDAILRSGATPVFVDIDHRTFNIDPLKLKSYLVSKGKAKPVGIIPVHLYGLSSDIDAISDIAEEYGLFVLEDVAQAFGGKWKDKRLGSIGDIAAFSFFPSKNLGGFGDAGLVGTNDEKLAELVRMLLKHGGKDKYDVEHIGYNARLDTIQAAILLKKMDYLEEFNEKREQIALEYDLRLAGLDYILTPQKIKDSRHVFHQYTIRVINKKRDGIREYLKNKGISTAVYYPVPLHMMKAFRSFNVEGISLAESEKAALEVLSLPIEPLMNKESVGRVASAIREYI